MKINDNTNHAWRRILLRLPWLLLIPIGLILPAFLSTDREGVERIYAQGIYPIIKNGISALTAFVPFSIVEFVLYALLLLLPTLLIIRLIAAFCKKLPWHKVVSYLLSICIAGGILLNLFYVVWGANYFRQPLAERMDLTVEARSVTELEQLCNALAKDAAALREQLCEDENGIFTYPEGVNMIFRQLPDAYAALAEIEDVFSGKVTCAKPVLWSEGLSWLGISGIYVAYTAEPNVNVDQPDLYIAHAAAHEMAHQLGIASENEAEFAAFLVCMQSDNDAIAYSAYMLALTACTNALYAADADRYLETAALYSEKMWRDLMDYSVYWKQFEGPTKTFSNEVNDSYLKHNAQQSGVKSYGEVVDLLLSYYSDQKTFRATN